MFPLTDRLAALNSSLCRVASNRSIWWQASPRALFVSQTNCCSQVNPQEGVTLIE